MCGIAGIVYRERGRRPGTSLLASMADSLAHRGPDDDGYHEGAGVGLAHRRLSIIDLEGGQQPIYNEDRSVVVVFNGEIYNYRDLVQWLEQRGHRFRTHSDTEVIVHLYEEVGDRLVEHLRGMFAFALWDEGAERLVLARDRLGIKPLYVFRDQEKIVFGSELRALCVPGLIERRIDARALDSYLALGMVPGPLSIVEGVEKLPAAHVASVRRDDWGSFSARRYWRLERAPGPEGSLGDWVEELESRVVEAVQAHLVADVPVGAFLSGGVDSSLVVATAAELSDDPIRTFSIGVGEGPESELPFARRLAEAAGTRHREEIVGVVDAAGAESMVRAFDEPFADTSAIPTLMVSRLARSEVKVVLSGDGGDEGFGGYDRYVHDLWEDELRRRLPPALRRLAGWVGSWWPKADFLPRPLRARTALQNLGLPAGRAYANSVTTGRQPWRRRLLASGVREGLTDWNPTSCVSEAYDTTTGDPLARMLGADTAVLLPDRFLTKVDRASMHFGLEVRPPLLDHELLEFAARLPSDLLIRDGEGKFVLKKVAERRVPREVLYRPKRGFDLPIAGWFRGPLAARFEETVLAGGDGLEQWIDRSEAGLCLARHRSGRIDHGELLWSVFVFSLWWRENLGSGL